MFPARPLRDGASLHRQLASTTMGKREAGERTLQASVAVGSNNKQHIQRPLIGKRPGPSRHGAPPYAFLVDDVSFSECPGEFQLARNTMPPRRAQLRLTAETNRIKFRAANHGEPSLSHRPHRYAVALIDTAQRTARIFDADLFAGRRIVKSLEEAMGRVSEPEEADEGVATAEAQKRSWMLLHESFGTQKTKRLLSSRERNRIDIVQLETQSSFISKALDSGVGRIAEGQSADLKGEETGGASAGNAPGGGPLPLLPPHSKVARRVEEIYRIQDLIPSSVYFALDVAEIVAALGNKEAEPLAEAVAPHELHQQVRERLETLQKVAGTHTSQTLEHTVRCLLYLDCLLKFRALNETKLNGDFSPALPMATSEVLSTLLATFAEIVTVGTGRQRYRLSPLCRDRLIAHVCILVLILDGFRTSATRLGALLQLPVSRMYEYLKAVGCTLVKPDEDELDQHEANTDHRSAIKMAVLKAPLTIAAPKPKRRRPERQG